jgi:hypothetical protein
MLLSFSENGAASATTLWAFAFFQAHKQVLLNLITTDEFFVRERS